jgi:copper chaperone CopZ
MIKTTLDIEGMMCSMCEAHICDTIRNAVPGAKKVSASRSKGKASLLSEEIPDREILMNKIAETGYSCTGIASEQYVKKGWFGRG